MLAPAGARLVGMLRMCTGGGGTGAEVGAAGGTGGGVDVLLVEDEAGLARSTREYLEAFGLRAEHRATAEKDAETHKDASCTLEPPYGSSSAG